MNHQNEKPEYKIKQTRLSDRILEALELALEQDDLHIAEGLTNLLEHAMTRKAGGGAFIERRDYPPRVEDAMEKLRILKENNKA